MQQEYKWFIGIDWGGEQHRVCVLDQARTRIGERTVAHTGQAIAELADWLMAMAAGEPEAMAAALEVPHGPLVEMLLAYGVHVFSLNPKQLDRFRDRYTVAGAKDDARDAFVLAACLMTDLGAYRRVESDSAFQLRVRELSRTAEDLEREHRRLSNQLRDLLLRYFPAVLALSFAADEPWIWALLSVADVPEKAARLQLAEVQGILRKHHIRRISATEVCSVLQGKALCLSRGTSESIAEHVGVLIPLLQVIHEQKKRVAKNLNALLDAAIADTAHPEHQTIRILKSLPGVGVTVTTTLLAEAGTILKEQNYPRLRCYAGVAPVTKQSGKSRRVVMRHGCNPRVRDACYHWARVSVQREEQSRVHYRRLREAGHGHGRALRGVCDRLLGVLTALLRTETLYDPKRRSRSGVMDGSLVPAAD